MNLFITILHVIVCVILILVVLLQAGKGANMGAAFGGSSQTIFGSSGAGTFLGKMTTIVAAIFMLTSLTLSYFSVSKGSSLMETKGDNEVRRLPAYTLDGQQLLNRIWDGGIKAVNQLPAGGKNGRRLIAVKTHRINCLGDGFR